MTLQGWRGNRLHVRRLDSSSFYPPKMYFLTFDDNEKRIFKYNTTYLAFFPVVHLWENGKQAAGFLWHPSSFSARHRQTAGQSALRFILLCLPVLELLQFIKSVGENIAMSALMCVTATSEQKEHLCVIWRVEGAAGVRRQTFRTTLSIIGQRPPRACSLLMP